MKYVFYDNDKLIIGVSEVMFKGKWYIVLYKTEEQDFLIIKTNGKYIKLDKYDVEDTKYNNLVYENEQFRLMNYAETQKLKKQGFGLLKSKYDIKMIYALANDMELYQFDSISLFIKDDKLVMTMPTDNDEYCKEYNNWFVSMLNDLNCLKSQDKRRGINKIMVEYLPSILYNEVNALLKEYEIKTDIDCASKIMDKDFVLQFVELINQYNIELDEEC